MLAYNILRGTCQFLPLVTWLALSGMDGDGSPRQLTSQNFCSADLLQSHWSWSSSVLRCEAVLWLWRAQPSVMMDFDERVPVGSNMYLPGCAYYVSGTEFSSLPPFLPQTPSSCPMTYSYSTSSLPQVQSVREVSFRDYAIDTSSKWHSRGNLPHCYATEDMVHRDCLSNPGTLGDMLSKNNSVLYHSNTSHTSNVYGSVGRNGVLPQAFDQFFETYGNVENQPSEQPVDRATGKAPPPAETGSDSCRRTEETERCEETSSPEPPSGNNEEKFSGSSSTYWSSCVRKFLMQRAVVKGFICCFISI